MSDNDNKNDFTNEEETSKESSQEEKKSKGFNFDDDDDSWWEESSIKKKVAMGIGFGILILGFIALLGLIVMNLWNWLMPEIFDLPTIDYWQTWGLMILSTILFKPMGSSSSSNSKDRKRKRELRRYMEENQKRTKDEASEV